MAVVSKTEARTRWKEIRSETSTWPSDLVCRWIIEQPTFQNARQVGIFSARPGEVDLTELWILRPDACVFPRVLRPDRLAYHFVSSLSALQPGFGGISEPDALGEPAKDWASSDLILVPGMAFDMRGGRVGTGAGFYDRYLSAVPAQKWAVGWDSQIVEGTLDQEATDVRMHALCTESGVQLIG